jgi:hypothetical protein
MKGERLVFLPTDQQRDTLLVYSVMHPMYLKRCEMKRAIYLLGSILSAIGITIGLSLPANAFSGYVYPDEYHSPALCMNESGGLSVGPSHNISYTCGDYNNEAIGTTTLGHVTAGTTQWPFTQSSGLNTTYAGYAVIQLSLTSLANNQLVCLATLNDNIASNYSVWASGNCGTANWANGNMFVDIPPVDGNPFIPEFSLISVQSSNDYGSALCQRGWSASAEQSADYCTTSGTASQEESIHEVLASTL